jgi:hypothetical protein
LEELIFSDFVDFDHSGVDALAEFPELVFEVVIVRPLLERRNVFSVKVWTEFVLCHPDGDDRI